MLIPFLVTLAALVGGVASWLARWSERQLHAALALSTGTFLGAVFLHLLPELEHGVEGAGHASGVGSGAATHTVAHESGVDPLWMGVLAGVLLVHLVEAVFLRTTDREGVSRHRSVSLVMLGGISVHAASAGLGLSALAANGALGTSLVAAFLVHKAFESFAMVNVFRLARLSRQRVTLLLALFSLVTPVCMVLGASLLAHAGAGTLDLLTALAAGTFLYVSIAELLPEVFHHREDSVLKFALLLAGIALSGALVEFGA